VVEVSEDCAVSVGGLAVLVVEEMLLLVGLLVTRV